MTNPNPPITITFRRGTAPPTAGSGLTLGEPAFDTAGKNLYIGLGSGVTAAWVGAQITKNSADVGLGLTAWIPTAGAVKGYIDAVEDTLVRSVNGATGAITDVARTVEANTFTPLQTFSGGISASGGITFGGSVVAPTRPVGTNDTTLATTAFVQSEIVADTVTSYNGRTGAVQGVSAAVAGTGISVSGATGTVTITNTGVTLAVAGTGISLSAGIGRVVITNTGASLGTNTFSGLQVFNAGISAAGGVTLASPNLTGTPTATTAAVGTNTTQIATTAFVQAEIVADTVTSFNGRTGAVQGVSAAVAGDGIAVSGATGSVTFTNTGVTRAVAGTGISVSGATGTVTITNIGAVSVNGYTGAITDVAFTNHSNTFTETQTISAIGGLNVQYVTESTESSIAVYPQRISFKPNIGAGTQFLYGDTTSGTKNVYLPAGSGTLALTSELMGTVNGSTAATTAVTSFNGRTGAVQGVSAAVAGDGIAVSGATGSVTFTNTGVTRAVAGTGISVSANTGTVTITNTGVQSFNGLTGAVSGVCASTANTFTALQTFNAGISASGGVTLNSSLFVAQGASFASAIRVTGSASITGHLTVSRGVTFFEFVRMVEGLSAANIYGSGGSTFGGNLWVGSGFSAATVFSSGGATVGGNLWVGSGFSAARAFVSGGSTFAGFVNFTNGTGFSAGFVRIGTINNLVSINPTSADGVIFDSALQPGSGALRLVNTDIFLNTYYSKLTTTELTADRTITLPDESGTVALRGANTFTGLQTLTAGLSAAGGITFNGIVSGSTASFSRLATFNAGISAAGATLGGTVYSQNGYVVGAGAVSAKTASYTLAPGDNGKIITMNAASGITLTVGTAVGTVGFSCTVIQLGAGQVVIQESGTTVNSFSGLKFAGPHAAASIICYGSNIFNAAGGLTG